LRLVFRGAGAKTIIISHNETGVNVAASYNIPLLIR
jgi:membrane-associated HD superfamily phosphohydrolase